jgi:hypothetical protein
VNRAREQAQDLRSGRAWAARVANLPLPPGPAPATTYASITAELVGLRTAIAADRPHSRPLAEVRRGHENLDRALASAVAAAFAADACGAPTPEGIVSWAAEGLARSYERELAIFAATDICGLALPTISRTHSGTPPR